MGTQEKLQAWARIIEAAGGPRPRVALTLGTGLGGVSRMLEGCVQAPYAALPGYPASTVASHTGRFCLGRMSGLPVILQEGRCHLYEGYSPEEVTLGVRLMAALGAEFFIVTNAAGALNPLFSPGEVMLIADQINFTGLSPLPGFTDMSAPYDAALAALTRRAALDIGLGLREGVFLGLRGPQMESRAETRMFRAWGADAVGMSTVLEVIAARRLGLRVLGLSALSNKNLPDSMEEISLEEVIRVSGLAAQDISRLLPEVLRRL